MPHFQIQYPPLSELMVECTRIIQTCPCASHWCFRNCNGDKEISLFLGYIQAEFREAEKPRETVKKRLFWITINPPPQADEDPEVFLDRITSLLGRRNWISQCYFSVEQRSAEATNKTIGIHAHLLVVSECPGKTVKRPAQAQREIYSWFSSIYPSMNKAAIYMQTFPMDYFDDKLDYIKGLKDDAHKNPKIEQDIIFRLRYGFQPYYHYDKCQNTPLS